MVEPPFTSVAVITNQYVPALIGMPAISPPTLFSLTPGGNEPNASRAMYGGLPPLISNEAEYRTIAWPFGNAFAPIVRGLGVAVEVGVADGEAVGPGVGVPLGEGLGVGLGGGLAGIATLPHHVPQLLLNDAYSWIVQKSMSLVGSITVLL